jgi:hypothetical protein
VYFMLIIQVYRIALLNVLITIQLAEEYEISFGAIVGAIGFLDSVLHFIQSSKK